MIGGSALCHISIVFLWSLPVPASAKLDVEKGPLLDIYNISLGEDDSTQLFWEPDYSSNTVYFEIHTPPKHKWFAIGFSERGDMFPADYCFLWKNRKRRYKLQDMYADATGELHLDSQQDCKGFKYIKNSKNVFKFSFSRQFDTCDRHDYIIDSGTTHLVWAWGNQTLYKAKGMNISATKEQGMLRIQLLKTTVDQKLPSHVTPMDILTDKVKIPPEETTYWCRVFKLPEPFEKTKHHIYQYGANIQETSKGIVHHMEVYHCEAEPTEEIPLYEGNCFDKDRPPKTQVCKRVLAAWAMGAPDFTYPHNAGLPIGGENFNPYVMLEVHYNNPKLVDGIVDSSGIRLYTSKILKKADAGILELGLEYTDKMAIPPRQDLFTLQAYCTSACTSVGLPVDGITVFGSQLHTHLTGVRVYTRHIDESGRELPELNRDNHYSTHFQEIRRLRNPVKVLPGHSLITKCDYNTEDRENITLGGFGIAEEMCVNFIHYYPHTDLEVCKSSISSQALNTYFQYMNEWEGQPTSRTQGISDNYKAIQWNKIRVNLLSEVYNEAPLSMQCNMSSGDRFPGYWENEQIPPVLHPLPPLRRPCEDIVDDQT